MIISIICVNFINDDNYIDIFWQTIVRPKHMDVDKEREELLNELKGLKEELARLKETASEYKLQYQAIKETKDQLNIAFEASTDAIVATNQEGKITLFNQAAEALFQYSSQEVIGQPIKILLRENIGDIHQGKMDKFLSKDIGQCGHIGKRTERTFRRKGGRISLKQKSGCLAGEAAENA